MREGQDRKNPVSRSETQSFYGAADFIVEILECEFDAFRVSGGAGGVDEDGGGCGIR